MKNLIQRIVYEPWPWYVGGPLIGLFVIFLLFKEKRALGISSSFEQLCAVVMPSKKNQEEQFSKFWQIWFAMGMICGGGILYMFGATQEFLLISEDTKVTLSVIGINDFSGYVPNEFFNFGFPQIVVLLVGGFLIGFGSRYAGGCTAGHSIMGIAQLAPASILSTVGFFIGGLISTYFLIPTILSV